VSEGEALFHSNHWELVLALGISRLYNITKVCVRPLRPSLPSQGL